MKFDITTLALFLGIASFILSLGNYRTIRRVFQDNQIFEHTDVHINKPAFWEKLVERSDFGIILFVVLSFITLICMCVLPFISQNIFNIN